MGKLSKDTSEQDVKDHFMRFGYVLDVYLPRGGEIHLCVGCIPECASEACVQTQPPHSPKLKLKNTPSPPKPTHRQEQQARAPRLWVCHL